MLERRFLPRVGAPARRATSENRVAPRHDVRRLAVRVCAELSRGQDVGQRSSSKATRSCFSDGVYSSRGSDDLYAIVDAPGREAMAAIAGTVGQTGALSKYETVVLLTSAQIDEAANMSVDYSPPGS